MFTITNIMIYIGLFLIGSIVGSFLNVVILRSEKDQEFVKTPSHCDHCGKQLKPWENIPIFSYIFLRGKCSGCKKRISAMNPIVESLVGLLFVFIYMRFLTIPFFGIALMNPNIWTRIIGLLPVLLWLMYVSILFLISVYDIRNMVVLDGFLVTGFFIGLIGEGLLFLINKYSPIIYLEFYHNILGSASFFFPVIPGIFSNLLGLFIGYAFIKLIVVVSQGRAMGDGDPIIAGFIGFILGTPAVFLFLFLSFLIGGVLGTILILVGKKRMKQYIAFGPYLALGGILTFMLGEKILWYYFHFMSFR